jgi:hypothetical protein
VLLPLSCDVFVDRVPVAKCRWRVCLARVEVWEVLTVRLWQDVVFDDYRISSQNQDRIAFTVDLTLLLRALKSSVSIYGDKLQVKLVRKRPSLSERPMPYLTFESKVCNI